jgi:signal transduction histidine kinase
MESMLSVVLISGNADVSLAVRAMKNGAVAVLEKPYRDNDLADAVRKSFEQSETLRRSRAELAEQRRRRQSLAPRERKMLDLVVAGVAQKRMARILRVSLRTVNRLCAAVYEKMGVSSAVELARIAASLQGRSVDDGPTAPLGCAMPRGPHSLPSGNDSARAATEAGLDRQQQQDKWMAYDLHDGVAQYLSMTLMHLEHYEQCRAHQAETADVEFQRAKRLLKQSLDELRGLIRGTQEAIRADSLAGALQPMIVEFRDRLEIEFVHDPNPAPLGTWQTSAIYRIVQESLTNAWRHSQSRKVRVELRTHGDGLCVDVKDWGTGFDVDKASQGRLGLSGIRERARSLGGEAIVTSAPGEGTSVSVRIPFVP